MTVSPGRVGRLSGIVLALTLLLSVLAQGPAKAGLANPTKKLPPAPQWKTAPRAMPIRPKSCPPLTSGTAASSAKKRPSSATQTPPPTGDSLWPPAPAGANPESYRQYRTAVTNPPTVPANYDNDSNNWKLTSLRTSDQAVSSNPQELCGVEGSSADLAWQKTTGRPTTVIAVLDSGIDFCQPAVVDKLYLNRGALPLPENAQGLTKPQLEKQGQKFLDRDPYDLDDSGIFNVAQYAADPRVAAVATNYGGLFCSNPQYGTSGIHRNLARGPDPHLLGSDLPRRPGQPRRHTPAEPAGLRRGHFRVERVGQQQRPL